MVMEAETMTWRKAGIETVADCVKCLNFYQRARFATLVSGRVLSSSGGTITFFEEQDYEIGT